jgi:hypothetical protein
MPLNRTLSGEPVVARVRELRANPLSAYSIAVAAVAIATGGRWVISGHVMEGLPFITFYPAIIIATLLGGLWPGILSVVRSGVVPVHSAQP